ncbi:peptidase U32 [Spirochaetia bacterium]|nr:peptidase U32 [Spirochaetia bacterium]
MSEKINRPELLAPAGDLEKLKTAIRFGADAVYAGALNYSLRTGANSLSMEQTAEGIQFAHDHGCKFYLAINIYAFDDDLPLMKDYFLEAEKLGIDAVIVSDPGVLQLIRSLSDHINIHISTQANTTNSDAVQFWLNNGAARIVAARELTLSQIRTIKKNVPEAELEVFVHGSICMAFSGRCLLSKYLTGRSANRGECTQPCRWEYHFQESTRPDDIFTAGEDKRGTYFLNSKDLCLIRHIPELVESGVRSFKIEGRNKSSFYTAMVTKVYREAIDNYLADPEKYQVKQEWLDNLNKIAHRPYTDGLMFPDTGFSGTDKDTEHRSDSAYIKTYHFVGVVENFDKEKKRLTISGRNRFAAGDELELLDYRTKPVQKLKIGPMQKSTGEIITEAHSGYLVTADLQGNTIEDISKHSILFKKC